MSTNEHLRKDITWKGIAQAFAWSLQSETELLKGRIYESLMRFPIIDWEYAHKRAVYHTAIASLSLMKAAVMIYNPSSEQYRKVAIMTTDIVEEWVELNA